MKKIILAVCFLISSVLLTAQTDTYVRVYQIMQTNCAVSGCHDNTTQQSGLDLEGAGASVAAKRADVYNNIVNVSPANATASAKGDHYIYKGRADKSYIFRKIGTGFESTVSLESGEGGPMPLYGSGNTLTDTEKELFRQWILYGAPATGEVVSETLVNDYYTVNGLPSFPMGAPAAPAPSEGFQIKMGPFFLGPQNNTLGYPDEIEYFQKWALDLPANVEVDRVDVKMGASSHHFILYNFGSPSSASQVGHGLRLNQNHSDISLVAAVQESYDLKLPQGAAFFWDNDIVLDLNSHYINYSATNTLKAEAYINVYTKPSGTANQEMHTFLMPNTNINIPNDGNVHTFQQPLIWNMGTVYLWALTGHTHKYGTDYKVYERNSNGTLGNLIYDASCALGVPGCATPYFDYQHIPTRFYDSLHPVTINLQGGIVHQASYLNNGPSSVGWGSTSDDEMMVLVMMFLQDTTGVVTTNTKPLKPMQAVKVYPNPADSKVFLELPAEGISQTTLQLFDITGKAIRPNYQQSGNLLILDRDGLPNGIYIYHLVNDRGQISSGKLIFK